MNLTPTGGPTGFAGKDLSQSLQSLGRNGDTVLAHLSPAEAELPAQALNPYPLVRKTS